MRDFLRVTGALLVAALGAALFAMLRSGVFWPSEYEAQQWRLVPFLRVFLLFFGVALVYALVVGLPAALYARRRGWIGLRAAAMGGFLVGALPTVLLLALPSAPLHSSAGDRVTSFNGIRTADGWWIVLEMAGFGGTADSSAVSAHGCSGAGREPSLNVILDATASRRIPQTLPREYK